MNYSHDYHYHYYYYYYYYYCKLSYISTTTVESTYYKCSKAKACLLINMISSCFKIIVQKNRTREELRHFKVPHILGIKQNMRTILFLTLAYCKDVPCTKHHRHKSLNRPTIATSRPIDQQWFSVASHAWHTTHDSTTSIKHTIHRWLGDYIHNKAKFYTLVYKTDLKSEDEQDMAPTTVKSWTKSEVHFVDTEKSTRNISLSGQHSWLNR